MRRAEKKWFDVDECKKIHPECVKAETVYAIIQYRAVNFLILLLLLWHTPLGLEYVAPNVDISLQSGRF